MRDIYEGNISCTTVQGQKKKKKKKEEYIYIYILSIQVVKNPQDLNPSQIVAVWLPQTLQKVLFCLKLL